MDDLSHFDDILLKFALGELSPEQMEIFNYFLEKCHCLRAEFSYSKLSNEVDLHEDFCERRRTGKLSEEEMALLEVLEEAYRKYLKNQ